MDLLPILIYLTVSMASCLQLSKASLGHRAQLNVLKNHTRLFTCQRVQKRLSRKTRLQVQQQLAELDLDGDDDDVPPPPAVEQQELGQVQEIQEEQVEGQLKEDEEGVEFEGEATEELTAEGEDESEEFMSTGSYLVDFQGEIPQQIYGLNFVWQEKTLGISVDQIFMKGQRAPITEYFFWPSVDAWEELRLALEQKTWIREVDQILMMNRCTEVINFWQEEGIFHSKEEAEAQFADCIFLG
eukprot:TRINITY_DN3272_c0_g1_i3.p2 TRINITY_DN3272_c0_g1~~TRINITY_DN3272_c0_g1_i3.p2  ORF type:complete len:242 (-),score=46.05 TRINITY_DN3272_c0_g1_i3:382-1107(-)